MIQRLTPFRHLLCAGAVALATLGVQASAQAAVTAANWNPDEQRTVTQAGLMSNLDGDRFLGAHPLSPAELSVALSALATRQQTPPLAVAAVAAAPLTVTRFDALLVGQLGLADVADVVQHQAELAGLRPPTYFGTEVVARFLNLRHMQPTVREALEPYPWSPVSRAEAAHSLAVVLGFSGGEVTQARAVLSTFALPHLSAPQRRVLSIAVAKIGMPYVWGGTTDNTADGLPHGGYDCSGFAWRVYKVSGLPAGRHILGRTAAQQAGEIPAGQRLHVDALAPGDLLFFGHAHFHARATEANIIHMGIALGNGWVIHSSDQGVYVGPLPGSWLGSSFAWGRRVL